MGMGGVSRKRSDLADQALGLLGGLGDEPSEVAASLERAGIRGRLRTPDSCPLARYLSAVVTCDPRVRRVLVSRTEVTIQLARPWQRAISVGLPEPARAFVAEFDESCFPALVEAGAR